LLYPSSVEKRKKRRKNHLLKLTGNVEGEAEGQTMEKRASKMFGGMETPRVDMLKGRRKRQILRFHERKKKIRERREG
jgi:hypothetical protein